MIENLMQNEYTFKEFAKSINNQELKAIALKIRNEVKKPDALWEEIKPLMKMIYDKDKDLLINLLHFVLE